MRRQAQVGHTSNYMYTIQGTLMHYTLCLHVRTKCSDGLQPYIIITY